MVISNPSFFKAEAQLINELFDLGMQRFHLRKPGSDKKAYELLLSKIDSRYLERIALHQFHELGPEFGIQRLHFKEHQRLLSLQSRFEGQPSITLSTSIHSINHTTDLHYFKYTFLGPVFQSISKENYPGTIPWDFQLKHFGETKVIALGGITAAKIQQLQQMNFDGAAVLGAVWKVPEQAMRSFKALQKACQTTR